MDGAGKSTAARVAAERLQAAGLPATVAWARLGQEGRLQDAIAGPVKRVVGSRGTVADPVAATIGADREALAGTPARRRTGPVAWVWTLVVAVINARSLRRTAKRVAGGENLVCDRWLVDSLVDLRVRYGHHSAAEWLLRTLIPQPDLAVLLKIDARTSMARKPEDQAPQVLARMESLYAEVAAKNHMTAVDARRSIGAVLEDVTRLVDEVAARRSSDPQRPGGLQP
jgi:thymidylate kinase